MLRIAVLPGFCHRRFRQTSAQLSQICDSFGQTSFWALHTELLHLAMQRRAADLQRSRSRRYVSLGTCQRTSERIALGVGQIVRHAVGKYFLSRQQGSDPRICDPIGKPGSAGRSDDQIIAIEGEQSRCAGGRTLDQNDPGTGKGLPEVQRFDLAGAIGDGARDQADMMSVRSVRQDETSRAPASCPM
jgi:hypothetical protein